MVDKIVFRIAKCKSFSIALILISSFCCFQKINAQNTTSQKKNIDSLIALTNDLYVNNGTKSLISLSQRIIKKSQKIGYEKGIVYGNFYIASALGEIGKYSESNKYIQRSQYYRQYLQTDPMQSSRNYGLLGDNYLNLGLYALCEKNYRLALNILKSDKNRDQVIVRTESKTYLSFAQLYRKLKMYDSVYYHINKGKALIKNIDTPDIATEKNLINIDLANYYLEKNQLDSSGYYFKKAIADDRAIVPIKIFGYQGLGKLYMKQKKYEDAERYLLQSIAIIRKNNYHTDYSDMYGDIGLANALLGKPEKSKLYFELYRKYTDSAQAAETTDRDKIINDVLKMERDAADEESNKKIVTLIIIGFLLMIASSVLLIYYHRHKNQQLLLEQECIVVQKEDENKKLKQKLTAAFDDVLKMAKANDPAFWTRFQEVYPGFKDSLSAAGPDLKIIDLTFCAYIYLGFSSKEISDYTFKAIKTVENYRYNVRKKLTLLPKDDLSQSIKAIVEKGRSPN